MLTLTLGAILSIACSKDDSHDTNLPSATTQENLPNISNYPIVGTSQVTSYNNETIINTPKVGDDFYGQNANYPGTTPQYVDNSDGTVTDKVTGLMWQQTLDHNGDGSIDVDDKLTYDAILELPNSCTTGGHTDWRVPTIKELYSLMNFNGKDVSGYSNSSTDDLVPFIDKEVFGYAYGDTHAGERIIDVQCASSNVYVGSNLKMVFGVNFADGRIKGYGTTMHGNEKKFNYLLVRGNTNYGKNNLIENNDGTITDKATGLMWMQDDNATAVNWKDALSYAENFEYAGYSDWRLPDIKELQSILDYTRSPETTNSAAISPLFHTTSISNEAGQVDYPFYWSSTTHANWTSGRQGAWGAYMSFGRAMGYEYGKWGDAHGAGAQRSDPKAGDPNDYPTGNGPQGDAIRIYNYVRLVRNLN